MDRTHGARGRSRLAGRPARPGSSASTTPRRAGASDPRADRLPGRSRGADRERPRGRRPAAHRGARTWPTPVDLVEEVPRLRGYDAIPSVLPAAPAGRGLTTAQRRAARWRGRWPSAGSSRCSPTRSSAPTSSTRSGCRRTTSGAVRCGWRTRSSGEQPLMRTDLLVDAARHAPVATSAAAPVTWRCSRSVWSRSRSPARCRRPGFPVGPALGRPTSLPSAPPCRPAATGRRRARRVPRACRVVGAGSTRPTTPTRSPWHARWPRSWGSRSSLTARRRARAVAPGTVRAPGHGRRHARRARGGAAPERRRSTRPAGACGRVRARPGRAARGGRDRAACRRRRCPTFPVAKEDVALVVDASVPAERCSTGCGPVRWRARR